MKNHKILLTTFLCVCACSSLDDYRHDGGPPRQDQAVETRVLSPDDTITISIEDVRNPYSLAVMQAVYDRYSLEPIVLSPTDIYVRFMPQDSSQLQYLLYESGLEMFDYPLDTDTVVEQVESDQAPEDTSFTWLYTTVSPNYTFPQGITHEVLDSCYIPLEREVIILTRSEEIDVEAAAYEMLGYDAADEFKDYTETRSQSSTPSGRIKVYDNNNGIYIPVKGVRIRGHRFVKYSIGYTDENGYYELRSNFRNPLHYEVVYSNTKGFDIWGNYGPLTTATIQLGKHEPTGYSKNATQSERMWRYSVINNSAYEYYKMCENTGILTPPNNLKIWCLSTFESSSAPMLRRIRHCIGLNGSSAWLNYFANIGYGYTATFTNQRLIYFMPDVTIGTENKGYTKIYETVNHELSHASHFSTVGSQFWSEYVSYIMTYGAYGSGTGNNAELCGVGEMWGYFMGVTQANEMRNASYSQYTRGGWIKPQVFEYIYENNILTKKQIFDCLTSNVRTYDALVERMYSLYPLKADDIEYAFLRNGINPSAQKP